MNIRTKIGACLSAFAMGLTLAISGGTPQAAAADVDGDTIPDQFEVSGWWNDPAGGDTSTPERKWTYPAYPVACNNDPAQDAIQVVWLTEPGQVSHLDTQLGVIRDEFRRAVSTWAASAKHVATNKASLQANRTPRFVTWEDSGGKCNPLFEKREVPSSVWDGGYSAVWNWGRTTQGFNDPNRKYLYVLQTWDPKYGAYGGIATLAGYYDGADKSTGNDANATSDIIVIANSQTIDGGLSKSISHEIGHALGAVSQGAPNRNPNNGGHPSDCMELLCYGPNLSAATGQVNVCGLENYSNPEAYRLDCGKNDYFNLNPGSANYLYTHFNLATDSTFIFNGATAQVARPTYDPNAVVVEQPHH